MNLVEKLKPSLQSAIWVAGTHGFIVVLRLLSSIILTRLLFPEAFGQVLIVGSIASLITLISEVGFRGSIINNPRGESDPGFINTIWTLMIARGFIVALVLLCISEFTFLLYPDLPEMSAFLKIAALSSAINGFMSTKMYQNEKRMNMKGVAIIQMVTRISAVVATVIFALIEPSASAILWGETLAIIIFVGLTHWYLDGTPNYFTIDKTATPTIIKYGRWILLATIMTWAVNEGHKFALGFTLPAHILGFYALAYNIAFMVREFFSAFSEKWVFPMYTKLGSDTVMESKAFKLRLCLMGLASVLIIILFNLSDFIIDLIYEDRYADAAKFIKIICIGSIGIIVADCYIPVFKSRADSFGLMKNRVVQATFLAIGLYLGFKISGAEGMIVGTAAASLAGGVATAWMARKHFTRRLYLLDSVVVAIPFAIWLYFERNALHTLFAQ